MMVYVPLTAVGIRRNSLLSHCIHRRKKYNPLSGIYRNPPVITGATMFRHRSSSRSGSGPQSDAEREKAVYESVPKRSVPEEHVQFLPSLHFLDGFNRLIAEDARKEEATMKSSHSRSNQLHGASRAPVAALSNIAKITIDNTVMPQCMSSEMSAASRMRRMMHGNSMYALTGGDRPSWKQQRTLQFVHTPNAQFACHLVTQRREGSGTTMRFFRGNMVRAGKSRPAASLRDMMALLTYADESYFAAVSVPNMVGTVVFKHPVGRKLKDHFKANKNDDFSGISINLDATTRCTPGIHLGYNKKTGIQRSSSAVLPGPRTVGMLYNCVKEINTLSQQFPVENIL